MKLTKSQCIEIAQALYSINRHAKTALDKKPLYQAKKETLEKLIDSGYAKKIGLHFSENPSNSKQHSTTLVEFHGYLFHLPVTPEDKQLPHLGKLDFSYANPSTYMNLTTAKRIIAKYVHVYFQSSQTGKKPRFQSLTSTPSPSEYRRSQKNPYKK
ncbi:YkyB family protein [Chryseomicrobium palamuruense]|uniref:YkyB family protein n=1 Tax=Chryseomicrobium palamuruense TaxID=682973 RepID=A0ABV8USX5_9BACL